MTLSMPTLILLGCVLTSLGLIIGTVAGYWLANRQKTGEHEEIAKASTGAKKATKLAGSPQASIPSPRPEPAPTQIIDEQAARAGLNRIQGPPTDINQPRIVQTINIPQSEIAPPSPPQSTLPSTSDKPAQKPTSMVGQINEILQDKLALSPIPNKVIQLTEDNQMGVIVRVNQATYHGIDMVPDVQVRAIIQSAVDEWVRRSEKR